MPCYSVAQESTCYGTTSDGRLEQGVQLPSSGKNFISYGEIPEVLGRTYVHDTVSKIVVDAYDELFVSHPNKRFKYAETGLSEGGEFSPHKTHRNGLSVDFMAPVVDQNNQSTHFSTHVFNKYGYNVDFNSAGQYEEYTIDFDALGAHLVELHKASLKNGVDIWRVLFAPDLQPKLYATQYGEYIKKHIIIPTKKSWVRHDEHYHVDFNVPCKPL